MSQVKELKGLDATGSVAVTRTTQEFFIQWHLTERCNLRCRHCYQTGGVRAEPSLAEVREVAAEASGMVEDWAEAFEMAFSPSFTITGGEPFLRRDLFEIIALLRGKGFAISVLSNGTMISAGDGFMLRDLGVESVQVSFEGPEEIHDRIRGPGTFTSAMRGVRNLLNAGLRVTMNCTLSRINGASAVELVAIAEKAGVHRLGFSRLVPSGKGKSLIGQMLTALEVDRIYSEVLTGDHGALEVASGDPVASQRDADGDELGDVPFGGCAAGVSGLTILPDGTITPCRRLAIPIGNIHEDSLRELWVTSPVLNAIRNRDLYAGNCGRCPRWAACRGCRAVAYAHAQSRASDNFLADDPQCFIRQQPGSRR